MYQKISGFVEPVGGQNLPAVSSRHRSLIGGMISTISYGNGQLLLRPVNNHESFGGTSKASVAVGDNGIEIETVAFFQDYTLFPVAEFKSAMQNIEKLFAAVIVEYYITGLSLLHFDDERFHHFVYFGIGERFILISDVRNVGPLGDTVPVFFAHHYHVSFLGGFLEKIADRNSESGGDFEQCGDRRRHQVVLNLGQIRFGQSGEVGQVLQGQTASCSKFSYLVAKVKQGESFFHIPGASVTAGGWSRADTWIIELNSLYKHQPPESPLSFQIVTKRQVRNSHDQQVVAVSSTCPADASGESAASHASLL